MWIRASVFTPFPTEDRGRNAAIINNVFDALVASLRAETDSISDGVRFFFMSLKVGI